MRYFVAAVIALCVFPFGNLQQEPFIAPHFFTGGDLLRACKNQSTTTSQGLVDTGTCIGYITGVVDAYSGPQVHAENQDGKPVLPLCLPDSITSNKPVVDMVIDYLNGHPDNLELPAANSVSAALRSFACKSGWPKGLLPPKR